MSKKNYPCRRRSSVGREKIKKNDYSAITSTILTNFNYFTSSTNNSILYDRTKYILFLQSIKRSVESPVPKKNIPNC